MDNKIKVVEYKTQEGYYILLEQLFKLYEKGKLINTDDVCYPYAFEKGQLKSNHIITHGEIKIQFNNAKELDKKILNLGRKNVPSKINKETYDFNQVNKKYS